MVVTEWCGLRAAKFVVERNPQAVSGAAQALAKAV